MPNNSNYQFRAVPLNLIDYVKKKTTSSQYYFRYLLDRTMMMFEYKNLPETIDQAVLERYLQVNGVACITEAKGKLYCFSGSWGGEQDVYYRPTKFIIANPHISQLTSDKEFSKEVTIYGDETHDAVLMRNDTEWASLTPLIARYGVLMCENCVTIRVADIMLRVLALLSAGTDKAKKSAEAYLSKLENGELGVIADSAFMESLKMQSPPSNNGSYLTQFIELQQYLKGSFFNELGLRANYNMKREAIGQGESTLDADAILPLCDNMLKCRREDITKVNSIFGTDIKVDFSSAWLESRLEASATLVSQLTEAGVFEAGEGEASENVSGAEDGFNGSENGSDGSGDESNGSENGSNVSGDESNGADKEIENVTDDKEDFEEAGRDGSMVERSGAETSETGESGETGTDRGGEERREEDNQEEVDKVREELDGNNMTLVEGLVEVMEEKVSQLIADCRAENGGDDSGREEVSETEGLPADN